MPESSAGEVNLAVEKSNVEQVEDEAKIQLTLLFISKVGEVLVDILINNQAGVERRPFHVAADARQGAADVRRYG